MVRHWLPLVVGLTLTVPLAGCGENSPPAGPPVARPYPVHGVITFPGNSPLVGGMVLFTPIEIKVGSKIRYEGASMVDSQGNYRIGLNGDGAGIPAGEYKVTIMPRDYMELSNSNSQWIASQYRAQSQTPLLISVREEDNICNIELQ